jgi:predicted nucleic acid-binding Zn ribbon protein
VNVEFNARRFHQPEPFASLLPALLKAVGLKEVEGVLGLKGRWARILGEEFARHTRAALLQRGVLTVEVDSAPRYQEFSRFHRAAFLSRLQEGAPELGIADLKFRPASF